MNVMTYIDEAEEYGDTTDVLVLKNPKDKDDRNEDERPYAKGTIPDMPEKTCVISGWVLS